MDIYFGNGDGTFQYQYSITTDGKPIYATTLSVLGYPPLAVVFENTNQLAIYQNQC